MVLLNQVINKGFDGGLLIQGLAKHVRNVLMAKDPQTLPLLEVSDQQRQRYQQQAAQCDTRMLYESLRIMNRCDINYRQSSNKRLLVELTLIEMAQITQPDEGPSAGRRPRRLKTLFKQLMQQPKPKNAAQQVAAAKPVASTPTMTTAEKPDNTEKPVSVTTPKSPTGSLASKTTPKLKSSISFSWNNVREMSKKNSIISNLIEDGNGNAAANEAVEFTQQDLTLQWLSMCNRMPQRLSGIATRMKNMMPVITNHPAIEVVVDNQLVLGQMEQIKGSIINTLKRDLHNHAVTLTMRVAEHQERERLLTRREQYEDMEKENPSVAKLRELFDLQLA